MGRSDWGTQEIELALRGALLARRFRQGTATDEGFAVSTLFADVFRAGEGVVEVAHQPGAKATFEQISAYRSALEAHHLDKYLWMRIVPVGPLPEYRLWVGYGVRQWFDCEEENLEKTNEATGVPSVAIDDPAAVESYS